MFDKDQTPIYILKPTIHIPANSGETKTTIVIPKEDISIIFNTEYFSFFVQLLPANNGSVITPEDPSILNLKSYVTLFLNYKAE